MLTVSRSDHPLFASLLQQISLVRIRKHLLLLVYLYRLPNQTIFYHLITETVHV